jgi:transposase
MSTVRTDEFRKNALRIALTSGLSRRQVADDLGSGMSTVNKWVTRGKKLYSFMGSVPEEPDTLKFLD